MCVIFFLFLVIFSHPKYRAVLFQKFPSLACSSEPAAGADTQSTTTTVTENEKSAA